MNKAIALLLICCLSFSSAASICSATVGQGTLCLSSTTCLIDATLLNTLCLAFGGVNAVLNLTIPSSVTVNLGSTLTTALSLGGLNINAASSTSASATVNFQSATTIAGDLVVTGAAVLNAIKGTVVTVNGNLQVAAQTTLNIAGNITVAGATTINGQLHLAGDLVQSAAQTAWLVATSTVTVDGGVSGTASITGNGGIDASVVIQGNVTINAGNSPGAVYVRGDFTLKDTSTLQIEVASLLDYDKIYIGGKFTRAGILHVDVGSYRPNNGQIFIFATHTSASGEFSISRGNFDSTLSKIHPSYAATHTDFTYGSATSIALPFALIALCVVGIVF